MTDNLQPYPAYKETSVPWLEEIPTHWEVHPGLAAYRPKQQKNVGMIETTVLSLSYGQIVVKPPEKLHGLVPESFETYQIVDPGDIIIRPTDLQNDWTSLRVGLSRYRGIITSAYLCLRTLAGMTSEYCYLLLHAYDLMKIFYGMGSGLRQNLDFIDLKRLPLLIPPPEEQTAIVRYLDHIDRRIRRYIRTKQTLIKLLNEQKQIIIQQAVTGGFNPDALRKDSGVEWLGEVPAHWEVWSIGRLAKVGNGSTPSRSNPAYWTNGHYPWLNSSSVNQGRIIVADQFVTDIALQECHLPRVQPGSVLIAITGQGKTRGTAAVLEIETTINQHIAYITPKASLILPDFLQMYLTASYKELRRISESGSTKGALTCDDVKRFKVVLPPLNEQQFIIKSIRQQLETTNLMLEHVQAEINFMREYNTRLIADIVTGKLDVRAVAAHLLNEVDEPDIFDETNDLVEEEDDIVELAEETSEE